MKRITGRVRDCTALTVIEADAGRGFRALGRTADGGRILITGDACRSGRVCYIPEEYWLLDEGEYIVFDGVR